MSRGNNKTNYTLQDLLISNNNHLDYYDRVLTFNVTDRMVMNKKGDPDKKIVKVVKDELKDIKNKKPIREHFHNLLTRAIQKEKFYCVFNRIELPYSVEVEKELKRHKFLIPPFARLNGGVLDLS